MSCSSLSLSKKRKTSCSLEISNMSPLLEVERIDDILMLILVRLPAKSIFRFLCVSKRWNEIISTPYFHKSFYIFRKALALRPVAYIKETYPTGPIGSFLRWVPRLTTIIPHRGLSIVEKKISMQSVHLVNSSNGLILFLKKGLPLEFLITNPVSKKVVCFNPPALPAFKGAPAMALICEENMHDLVLNYKIVHVDKREGDSHLTIHTFCSKTGLWSTSIPTATRSLIKDRPAAHSCHTHVVDGIVHWITSRRDHLFVYYMEYSVVQIVDLPSECRKFYHVKVSRPSRDNDLWLCMLNPESCTVSVWMMPREEYDSDRLRSSTIPSNSWVLIHTLGYPAPALTPATAPTPKEEVSKKSVYRRWWRKGVPRSVPCIYMCTFFQTYVDRNHFNAYEFFKREYPDRTHFNRNEYTPYTESLTLSSYAL